MKKEFSTNDHIHPDNGKNPHNQDSPKNGTWNDHQLEQLLVKHWGIFPPQTKPGKPGRHSSVVTVSDTNLSDG